MTATIMTKIECDAPDCDDMVFDVRRNRGGANLTTIRWRLARDQGWQTGKVVDLCPKHRTKPLVFHEFLPGHGKRWGCTEVINGKTCYQRREAYIHQVS